MKEDRLVPRLRGKEYRPTVELWAWRKVKHRRGRGFMLVHHCSSCGARTYPFEDRLPSIITDQRAGQLPEVPHDELASQLPVILIFDAAGVPSICTRQIWCLLNGLILADGTPAIQCLMCQENASE